MPVQWSSGSPGSALLVAAKSAATRSLTRGPLPDLCKTLPLYKTGIPRRLGNCGFLCFHEVLENTGRRNAAQGWTVECCSRFRSSGSRRGLLDPPPAEGKPFSLLKKLIPKRKELTMDEILITGGKVVLRSVQETKTVTVDDFYAALSQSAGLRTPVLPERVIFYAAKSERRLYLTHQHPVMKTIKVRNADDEIVEYSLSLPHVYFMHVYFNCAMEKLYVFCSGKALNDSSDTMCKLPLKNIHGDGLVCIGDDLKFSLEGRLDDKIAATENFFWESVFNSDLDSCFTDALPEVFKRGMSPRESGDPLLVWERLSTEIGFQVSGVKWKSLSKLSEIATDLLED